MDGLRRRYRARVLGSVRRDMRIGFMILRRELTGSWRDIDRDLVRARTLSAEEIQAAAREYLVRDNSVVARVLEGGAGAGGRADGPGGAEARTGEAGRGRGRPARSSWTDLVYEERPFVLPSGPGARRVLGNGIRAFVVPNVGDPVFRISARVLGGSAEDPIGKEGLADLAASMLDEAGIPGLAPEALREHLEGMVGSVSTSSDMTSHELTVTVFPSDVDEGLRILRLLLAERIPMRLADLGAATVHEPDGAPPAAPTTPGAVAQAMLDALKAGDVEGMQSHTTQAFRARLAEDPERAERLRMLPHLLGQATLSDPEVDTEGETATVRVPLEASMGGNTMQLVVLLEMVQEDGAWKCETFGIER